MLQEMGILDRLRSSFRPETRPLQELAEVAGRSHALVQRLRRHAELSSYPQIRKGLERLAREEAAHLKSLNSILADHDVWARFPERALRDGSNNWKRLGGDLELLCSIGRDLNRLAVEWEPIDAGIAARLSVIAGANNTLESDLRLLTEKCDPQAIN